MEIGIFMFRLYASGSSVPPPSVGTRKSQKIYMSRRKLRTPSFISFKLCTYITFVVRRTCILLGVYSTGLRIFGLCLIKKGSKGLCENLTLISYISFKCLMIAVAVYLIDIFCKTDPIVMN